MGIKVSEFGKTSKGSEAHLYTVVNSRGMAMEVSDYGATLVSIIVPDAKGRMDDVLLGYGDVQDYEKGTCYFGACIGRNGNRVKNAQAVIGGKVYQMEKNEGENSLHSGSEGYSGIIWDAEADPKENSVRFHHTGADGEQGLPGTFDVTVTYTLTDENEIRIHYEGISDKDTIANMTNHGYYNLAGHASGNVENHVLWLDASAFTPVGEGMIPTGEILDVEGTPMDFRVAKKIGRDIGADYEQLKIAGGYDHNYVLPESNGSIRRIAQITEETCGRTMEVLTDAPGVQFYAGNFVESRPIGKEGVVYGKRSGLCLETQGFPDAGHHEAFPTTVLKAGDKYDTTTIYRFGVLSE